MKRFFYRNLETILVVSMLVVGVTMLFKAPIERKVEKLINETFSIDSIVNEITDYNNF